MNPTATMYTGGYQWGVSASGTDVFDRANMAGLTGDATYVGPATGLYMREETDGSAPEFDSFSATARLVADFGSATNRGSISGTIYGGSTTGGVNLPGLNLTEADILNNGEFHDNVSGTAMLGTREIALHGSWGGQFFGNGASASDAPGSVGAIFSAEYYPFGGNLLPSDGQIAILGALGAHLE